VLGKLANDPKPQRGDIDLSFPIRFKGMETIVELRKTSPGGAEESSPGWSAAEPWESVEKLIKPQRGDIDLSFPIRFKGMETIVELRKTSPGGAEESSPGWSAAEPWESVEKLIKPQRGDIDLSFPPHAAFACGGKRRNK